MFKRIGSLFLSLVLVAGIAQAEQLCNIAASAIRKASQIRSLEIVKPVPCVVHNHQQIKEYLLYAIDERVPAARLAGEEKAYKAIGFIPHEYQYKEGIIQLYLSQIGGYYDPEKGRFVMASWMPVAVQNAIAVHELTHALQDQYFNLHTFLDPKTMDTDELLARAALVEGDASAVMIDYTRQLVGQAPIEKESNINSIMLQNLAGVGLVTGSLNAPETIVQLMVFPYTSGLRFAHALLREGGYKRIDSAFKSPPLSTEEILHPAKFSSSRRDYLDFEGAKIVPEGISKDYRIVYEDTLGEFVIASTLAAHLTDKAAANLAAQGWGGDRIVLLEGREDNAKEKPFGEIAVWHTNWDSDEDAVEFYEAYKQVLEKLYGDPKNSIESFLGIDDIIKGSPATWNHAGIFREGRAVTVLLGGRQGSKGGAEIR